MRIFTKNSIIDRLSLPLIISSSNNTFFIICIDNFTNLKTILNNFKLKHSSILKMFDFSDSYICFSRNKSFFHHLDICVKLLSTDNDGTNAMLAFVYQGSFVNCFNPLIVNVLIKRFKYSLDLENYFVQLMMSTVLFIELFLYFFVDLFFLNIEDELLNF